MSHTASLDDWLTALSVGQMALGALGFSMSFVDADLADFDPRPAVRRATGALHQGAVHAGHDLNRAIATSQRVTRTATRDAAITAAALLMLLTAPEGTAR